MRPFIALILALFLSFSLSCSPSVDGVDSTRASALTPTTTTLALFPLVGQSNMSGRGILAGAPSDLTTPNSDIYVFANDYTWKLATEPVDSPTGQVDTVSKDTSAAVGPSMAFALQYLADHPGVQIGLIPCAMGGKTIHEWRRQSLVDSTLTPIRSNLYGSCLHRIHQAQAYGTVAGLLIYEGESDTRDPAVVAYAQPLNFAVQMETWVNIWRADLLDPDLPVVFAQLATTTDTSLVYWDEVKSQQATAAAWLTHTSMVTTDDLALNADGLHLTTASQVTLGQRFAAAMLSLE